jgi:type III pantothenate kinase
MDIGNSRVKLGCFEGTRLLHSGAWAHADFPAALMADEGWRGYSTRSKYLGLVSVGKGAMVEAATAWAATVPGLQVLRIDRETPLPIENAYGSPQTLGIDRLMVAVAALQRAGRGPVLVVNAGTALTYDYVDAEGRYRGGGISLGMQGRFKALNAFTAALPLVAPQEQPPLVGDDTEGSIRSGVVWGIVAEIEGIVARYHALAGEGLQVFLTGGDAGFLGNHLKCVTFADANLLLYGINTIILQHAQ